MLALLLVVGTGCGASSAEVATRDAGEVTLDQGFARVRFTVSGLDSPVSGQGWADFTTRRSQTTATGLGRSETTVVVDAGRTLVHMDGVTPPRSFVRLAAGPSQAQLLGSAGRILMFLQPIQLLQLLGGATEIDSRGSARVNRAVTTVQGARIDLDRAARGPHRRALRRALDAMDAASVAVQVSLDDAARVLRLETELRLGDGEVIDATHWFTDFGPPVEVDVPDASSVVGVRRALDLAEADLSGQWTAAVVARESSPPGAATLLPEVPIGESFRVECSERGRCRTGEPWTDRGGGSYVFRTRSTVPCPDRVGTVAATGRVEVISAQRIRVVSAEGGRAVELVDEVTEFQRTLATPGAVVCLLAGGGVEATVSSTVRAVRP